MDGSLRVAVVGFVVVLAIFFLVALVLLVVLFLIGLLSKEDIGGSRVIGRGIYSAHSQSYAFVPPATNDTAHPRCVPAIDLTTRVQSMARNQRRTVMAQKVIEVVGTSKESFAKAAENAVAEAAKTIRGLKWARVAELEMELDGKKVARYRATTKIYFDIDK